MPSPEIALPKIEALVTEMFTLQKEQAEAARQLFDSRHVQARIVQVDREIGGVSVVWIGGGRSRLWKGGKDKLFYS